MRFLTTITILVAAVLPAAATTVHAEESTPAPAYSYPPCYQDPDVTCVSQPGDPESHPSYASGQYPDGWYAARYDDDKPNAMRRAELAGVPYVAPTPAPQVQVPVQDEAQVEPTPAAVTLYDGPAGPPAPTNEDSFLAMVSALLYS